MDERPVSLLDWAYKQVRRMLFSGDLPQGQKIVVAQLANQLSISPTPVKEALNRLAAEGLFGSRFPAGGFSGTASEHQRGAGYFFECRIMLETFAAAKAIDNFPNHPKLQEEMRQSMETLKSTDPHDYVSITEFRAGFPRSSDPSFPKTTACFSLFQHSLRSRFLLLCLRGIVPSAEGPVGA